MFYNKTYPRNKKTKKYRARLRDKKKRIAARINYEEILTGMKILFRGRKVDDVISALYETIIRYADRRGMNLNKMIKEIKEQWYGTVVEW